MKHIYKPVLLILLFSVFCFSCKKSSSTPALVTFMKLDTNGKAVNYNACFTAEFNSFGQPETKITSQGGNGYFSIILNHAPTDLKTGQVYTAQTIKAFQKILFHLLFTNPAALAMADMASPHPKITR